MSNKNIYILLDMSKNIRTIFSPSPLLDNNETRKKYLILLQGDKMRPTKVVYLLKHLACSVRQDSRPHFTVCSNLKLCHKKIK